MAETTIDIISENNHLNSTVAVVITEIGSDGLDAIAENPVGRIAPHPVIHVDVVTVVRTRPFHPL